MNKPADVLRRIADHRASKLVLAVLLIVAFVARVVEWMDEGTEFTLEDVEGDVKR